MFTVFIAEWPCGSTIRTLNRSSYAERCNKWSCNTLYFKHNVRLLSEIIILNTNIIQDHKYSVKWCPSCDKNFIYAQFSNTGIVCWFGCFFYARTVCIWYSIMCIMFVHLLCMRILSMCIITKPDSFAIVSLSVADCAKGADRKVAIVNF